MTAAEASEAIQRLLEPGLGTISFARHAHERALEKTFTTRDVEHVLRNGIVGNPTRDERFENWTCRVSGADLDGDELTVVVALEPAGRRIRVITGF